MATITKTEFLQHPGAIWKRIVEVWEYWLEDATKSWAFTATTTLNSKRNAKITLVGAVDTEVFNLCDYGQNTTMRWPIDCLISLAGWNTTTKAWPPTVAGRTVLTEWSNKLIQARRDIQSNWTNGYLGTSFVITDSWNATFTGVISLRYWGWVEQCRCGTDSQGLITYVKTADEYIPEEANLSAPVENTNVVTIGSGGSGGAVDVSGIVTALEDIARRDVATSIDNGNVTVYNYSGDIVEPP